MPANLRTLPFIYPRSGTLFLKYLVMILVSLSIISSVKAEQLGNIQGNTILNTARGIDNYQFSPDGSWLLYTIKARSDKPAGTYIRSTDGSGQLIKLPAGLRVYVISPDSSSVSYAMPDKSSGEYQLYNLKVSVPVITTKLNGRYKAVSGIQISSDSTTVIYKAIQDNANIYKLYSQAADGSSAVVELTTKPSVKAHSKRHQRSKFSARISRFSFEDTAGVRRQYARAIDTSGKDITVYSGQNPFPSETVSDGTTKMYPTEKNNFDSNSSSTVVKEHLSTLLDTIQNLQDNGRLKPYQAGELNKSLNQSLDAIDKNDTWLVFSELRIFTREIKLLLHLGVLSVSENDVINNIIENIQTELNKIDQRDSKYKHVS